MAGPATLDDLRSFVQSNVRKIGRGFTSPADDWMQVAFIQGPEFHILGLANDLFANGVSKNALGEFLRQQVVELGAYRYALLLNVHGLELHVDDEAGRAQMERVRREELRLEQLEGAREWLWLLVGDAEQEQVWRAPIEFTPRLLRTPGRWERMDTDPEVTSFSGRFIGLNEYLRRPR